MYFTSPDEFLIFIPTFLSMNDLKLAGVFNITDKLIRQKVMKTDPINNRYYVCKPNKP